MDQLTKPRPTFIDLAREPDFRLGAAEVLPSLREVRLGDKVEVLEPRVMQVLVALVRAKGKPLTRDDLIEQCWGGVIVGDDAITRCISLLRRLGEALGGEAFRVETVAKVGYRLTSAAPAQAAAGVHASATSAAPAEAIPTPTARRPAKLVAAAAIVVVLLAGAAAIFLKSGEAGGWVAETYLPVAEEAGALGEPALSPNGRQLAYTKGDDFATPYDVWLRRVDGGPPVRLTNDPVDEGRPAWSPDGDELAYARQPLDRPCELIVHALPAGPARVVGRCRTNNESDIAWDHSGRALYFEDAPRAGAPQAIYRLDLDGAAVRPVTRPPAGTKGDNNPRVSPDGRRIAFERNTSDRASRILVRDLSSGRERVIAAGLGDSDNHLAWSPDGREIIATRPDDWGLWAYPVSGDGGPRPVTSAATPVYGLDAVGDRAALLLTERRWNLTRVAGDRRAPLMPGLGLDAGPDIAANGAVVFEGERPGAALYVIQPGAAPLKLELPAGLRPELPSWSPDGRRIAFRSGGDPDGKTRLYVVTADGSGLVRLPAAAIELSAPEWTGDGRALIYPVKGPRGWSLWQVAADGRSPPRDLGLNDWRVARTLGGATYAVREGEGYAARDSLVYRLDPGKPPVVVARCPELFARGDWVVAGGRLYILAALDVMLKAEAGGKSDRMAKLWVNDLDGRPMRIAASAPRAFTNKGIAVDPKSGEALYTPYSAPNQQIGVMTLKRQRRWF